MSEQRHHHPLRIGYALTQKKTQTFILPSLINHAKQHNIELIPIDTSKPLLSESQSQSKSPPFDCIIHKIYGPDWTDQLHQFSQKYPFVPIIDPPSQIEKLNNRVTMLDAVTRLKITQLSEGSFGIPKQVVVFEENELLGLNGIEFPAMAKPLVADGCVGSHDMYLVFNSVGFRKLSLPVVLQEFVNHGGVVFKVYVVGDHVECVSRKSLPDVGDGSDVQEGAILFSRVSNLVGGVGGEGEESVVVMPPWEFVQSLAKGLREELGLSLFNFDLIRDASDQDRYLIIDINYFPGYAKMPNFEEVMVRFFGHVASKGRDLGGSGGGGGGDGKESEVEDAGDGE